MDFLVAIIYKKKMPMQAEHPLPIADQKLFDVFITKIFVAITFFIKSMFQTVRIIRMQIL